MPIINQGRAYMRQGQCQSVIETVKLAQELLDQEIEACQLKGEALVMIGQEEANAEKAIELLK